MVEKGPKLRVRPRSSPDVFKPGLRVTRIESGQSVLMPPLLRPPPSLPTASHLQLPTEWVAFASSLLQEESS